MYLQLYGLRSLSLSNWLFALAGLLVIFGATASPAWAANETVQQAADQLTSQAESFRDEQEALARKPKTPAPTVIEDSNKPQTPPAPAGPKLLVAKIELEGNTIFPAERFRELTSAYENRESSFEELAQLAEAVANVYRIAGFSTTTAFIPPQKIKNGVVILRVAEGQVGEIRVEGNRYFKNEIYADGIRMRPDHVFNYQDLEASLYFLNRKPDLSARAFLGKGQESGTSDILLKAEEDLPLHVSYEFHNRGTKLTHRERQDVRFWHNNITGNGDIFNATVSMAEEAAFDAAFFAYELPMDRTGTALRLSSSYVHSRLIGDLADLGVVSNSFTFSPGVSQNLVRRPEFILDWMMGFEFTDSHTKIDGQELNRDDMRVFKTGPELELSDAHGRTRASADINVGLPGFIGGSETDDGNLSRVDASPAFSFFSGQLTRVERIPNNSFMVFRTSGQWTDDTLTSVEVFRAGGANSVRGYPESDAAGDYGYSFSLELNVPFPLVPDEWRIGGGHTDDGKLTGKKFSDAVRWILFIDGGKAYSIKRATETTIKDRFLLGVGTGLRVDLDERMSLQCDFGWPIGDDSSEKNRVQTHLSFKAGL